MTRIQHPKEEEFDDKKFLYGRMDDLMQSMITCTNDIRYLLKHADKDDKKVQEMKERYE